METFLMRSKLAISLASRPFPDGEPFSSEGAVMASRDHFQQELRAQIERAIKRGAEQLIVNSGELSGGGWRALRPQASNAVLRRRDERRNETCAVMDSAL
jgi:hypothetical protein